MNFILENRLKNRSGFVNILGVPNSGKSTLLNKLVGRKVSIVSHKVQTTRFCVKGLSVCTLEDHSQSQIIFIDIRRFNQSMIQLFNWLTQCAVICWLTYLYSSIIDGSLEFLISCGCGHRTTNVVVSSKCVAVQCCMVGREGC